MQRASLRNQKCIQAVTRKNKENYLEQKTVIKLRKPFCIYLHEKKYLCTFFSHRTIKKAFKKLQLTNMKLFGKKYIVIYFLFYLGFLSRMLMIQRTVGEGIGTFLFLSIISTYSQVHTFLCSFENGMITFHF